MPNKPTHLIAGVLTGAGIALARIHYIEQRSLLSVDTSAELISLAVILLFSAAVGGQFGLLPDILESSKRKKWRHRRFFHSYGLLVLIVCSVFYVETSTGLHDLVRHFSTVAAAGYLSHLLLDSRTPSGLPLF